MTLRIRSKRRQNNSKEIKNETPSAVYDIPGEKPLTSCLLYPVDFRYPWQGPQMIGNGGFDQGMTGWSTSQRTEASGSFSLETGRLKAQVVNADNLYSLVLIKPIGYLKAGVDYQLSFKAKNLNGSNQIRFAIRGEGGAANVPFIIEGQTQPVPRHAFDLTESMVSHAFNFRLAQESDIEGGMLLWTFYTENDVMMDDVSLRRVDRNRM